MGRKKKINQEELNREKLWEEETKRIYTTLLPTSFKFDDIFDFCNELGNDYYKEYSSCYSIVNSYLEYNVNLNTYILNYISNHYTHPVVKLISYICNNIKTHSNKIVITESKLKPYLNSGTLFICINMLIKANIIKKTTKESVYVVNHNYILRGSHLLFEYAYQYFYNNDDKDNPLPLFTRDGDIVLFSDLNYYE